METPKKGFKWSAEAERDLYAACLVAVGEPKGNTLRKAVEILEESMGLVVTVKAASHRIQHLQKLKRKEGTGTPGGGSARKKTATPQGKKRSKAAMDDDEEEDDADATPSKKAASGKKAVAPTSAYKDEEDDYELKPVKNEKYIEDSDVDAV